MTIPVIEIIPFSDEYKLEFERLNRAWIEKYFVLEKEDAQMLSDPKKSVLDNGGNIFFAKYGNRIVGTFALVHLKDDVYSLSKMAVDEAFRGRQIGNALLTFCIRKAREMNARKLVLYSNTTLEPAIHLYKKFGFKEVPLTEKDFERADIKMEYIVSAEA